MDSDPAKRAKRIFITEHWRRELSFDPTKYLGSPELIAGLQHEKLRSMFDARDLQEKSDSQAEQIRELEVQNSGLSIRLAHSRRQSMAVLLIMIVAGVLLSLGANVVTSEPSDWTGWVMVGSSIALQLIAILITFQQRR